MIKAQRNFDFFWRIYIRRIDTYEQFIQTERGKEWKHFWQSQTGSERSGDFGDYLYDFYPEMLNI